MNRIDHISICRGFYEALIAGGHILKGDEDDPARVDQFALSGGYCNGPVCVLCHDSWCVHCESRRGRTPPPCPNAAIDADAVRIAGALPAP